MNTTILPELLDDPATRAADMQAVLDAAKHGIPVASDVQARIDARVERSVERAQQRLGDANIVNDISREIRGDV